MTDEIQTLREKAECAKIGYMAGEISREEAASLIKPYADAFNEKSKELARKYHLRPQRFSIAAFFR